MTPSPAAAGWRNCPLTIAPGDYVNPLAAAIVKPERIDQGVDYAGVGRLAAIGAGRITYLAEDNTGWPGAFIEYQLLDGADAGCYVFYAEGVTPADGLRVGDTIRAGQPIATIIPMYPTGIEIGWGAGIHTKTYAKVAGQWSPFDDRRQRRERRRQELLGADRRPRRSAGQGRGLVEEDAVPLVPDRG